MNRTRIEWCEYTWNPVTGCIRGCPYCYASTMAHRFAMRDTKVGENVASFILDKKFEGIGGKVEPFPFAFTPTFHRYRLTETQREKHPRMIFVCSMGDLFGPWIPDEWIKDVFDACKAAPQHLYFFLAKYPERYGELYRKGIIRKWQDNFWYGSTITDSKSRRFPGTIGMNTFLSIEPLHEYLDVGLGSFGGDRWIIIGAETGNRKGKIVPEKIWIANIAEAAKITHAAVFMKNSLMPIIGKEYMRQEWPPSISAWMEARRGIGKETKCGT